MRVPQLKDSYLSRILGTIDYVRVLFWLLCSNVNRVNLELLYFWYPETIRSTCYGAAEPQTLMLRVCTLLAKNLLLLQFLWGY
jgi:hypothetical protein